MNELLWKIGAMTFTGDKRRSTQSKDCPSATLSTTNPASDQSRVSAITRRELIDSAMPRPKLLQVTRQPARSFFCSKTLHTSCIHGTLLGQGCTYPGSHVVMENKFCTLAPNICGTLLHVILLAHKILRWFLDFFICAPFSRTFRPLKIRLLGCLETSETNYPVTWRHMPTVRRISASTSWRTAVWTTTWQFICTSKFWTTETKAECSIIYEGCKGNLPDTPFLPSFLYLLIYSLTHSSSLLIIYFPLLFFPNITISYHFSLFCLTLVLLKVSLSSPCNFLYSRAFLSLPSSF